MLENLLKQLETHLKIIEESLPDTNRFLVYVVITASQENLHEAKKVFKKHHLRDLDKRERVFLFEIYMRPVTGKLGVENLRSAFQELDDMGIEGAIAPHPADEDKE